MPRHLSWWRRAGMGSKRSFGTLKCLNQLSDLRCIQGKQRALLGLMQLLQRVRQKTESQQKALHDGHLVDCPPRNG